KNGNNNLYFDYRIAAATDLYLSEKIKFILISGDNGLKDYNEPLDMKNDLIKNGVPEDKIILDYAGFRTFDSVLRAKYIFGQDSMVIISQEFHNKRALYIAKHYGIKAIAYNAKDVNKRSGIKVQIREKISRVKVFIDILTNKQPKYWGGKIEIK
ncbi:MAG: ElyC/SanA/YdcF family protein, partial [Candidatus Paceibacterota bacterium]